MMDPVTIHNEALKAARRAARLKKIPLVIEAEDLPLLADGEPVRGGFPFVGDYVPKGWTRTENVYFVDSSGWGSSSEPALTIQRFLEEKVIPGRGYAVVEAGQFQVYVAEYLPPRAK